MARAELPDLDQHLELGGLAGARYAHRGPDAGPFGQRPDGGGLLGEHQRVHNDSQYNQPPLKAHRR